jgi:allophanate hydrolase
VTNTPETIADIVAAHRAGAVTPAQTIARSYRRIHEHGDAAIFITLRDEADATAEADALTPKDAAALPLYGVPVAVKDNIDVAGLPTTAGCPAYAYASSRDAAVVARLRAAGAIVIGKTNLDQFATGLVGTRSPYGIPKNALRDDLVPGGSSSGSAVAVAAGLVPLALGTDTAGSGRVPAMLNNIVGLKPSLGLVPTTGVVPACRTLDCVSIFALTTDDAFTALRAIGGYDSRDPFSRKRDVGTMTPFPNRARLGVPRDGQLIFFGDDGAAKAFDEALRRLTSLGATLVEFDLEPFYETARLLYEGPWVAERLLVIRDLLGSAPDAVLPVTREVILAGARVGGTDAFAAMYRLQELKRVAETTFATLDALVLPTTPTVYTIEQARADPIELNSRLGTYTNFVNLLDLCGLAIPAAMRAHGIPFGITLVGPGGLDAKLASIGRVFHAATKLAVGAKSVSQHSLAAVPAAAEDTIEIAVVGAHLSGMALNGELQALDAKLVRCTTTAPDYRFFALGGAVPPKPGLLRVEEGGGAKIVVEVWALAPAAFGKFVAAIPPPLSIGTLKLADGSRVKGFLVEAAATEGARDISDYGGWRAFLASGH